MEWQPIETAPKGEPGRYACGPRLLGYHRNWHQIAIMQWDYHANGKTGRWKSDGRVFHPTHWMPLPPPPDTPSQDGRVQSSKTSTELDAALKFLLSKT